MKVPRKSDTTIEYPHTKGGIQHLLHIERLETDNDTKQDGEKP